MTCFRLAATAALCIPALFVTASVGEAAKNDKYSSNTTCKTRHTMKRDFAKLKTRVKREVAIGDRAGAAALVNVPGAKVITKLFDFTPQGGDNVVPPARDRDTTNDRGVARTRHEFNRFGTYRVKVKVKVDGDVVARDSFRFNVTDRDGGECDPPLQGA